MKLTIIGDGSFGSFFKELLSPHFELTPWEGGKTADSIILAVPISAYASIAAQCFGEHHLINVCSVQKPSTDILLGFADRVTSIHPLFGRRTPVENRNSILTYSYNEHLKTDDMWWTPEDDSEREFLRRFKNVSSIIDNNQSLGGWKRFTPDTHDILMAKTHVSAMMAAKQLSVFTDRVKDVPDELLPNSFRLMRNFVKTLDDMPAGTIESIMANPYI